MENLNFINNHEKDTNLIFSRHLDEIDDLEKFGRDASILDSQENKDNIERTTNLLVEKIENNQRQAVIFVVSPRIRAIQTAELLQKEITTRLNTDKFKFRLSLNNDLRASE